MQNTNHPRAVIFDLDGVIVSTDHYHYLAWKQLADRLNIPFDQTVNNRLRGVSRAESLEIVLEKAPDAFTAQQKEQLAAEKNDAYRRLLHQMSPADLAEQVRATLTALRGWGYKLAIGSSSKNAPFILERIGLEGYFDAVADGNHITHSKPHPEVFLCAAARLGLSAADCWVVEDAVAGVQAAKAAGMVAVAIGDAAQSGLANHDLGSFGQLAALLGPEL